MNSDPSPKRKISEMISEMAASFISGGKTPEEKHYRLTAACSAWNMACGSLEMRRQQLEQYAEGYRQNNPATSQSDLANIRKVMESLMERKLQMFPGDQRQIVNARVVMVGNDYRIEVESTNFVVTARLPASQGWYGPRSRCADDPASAGLPAQARAGSTKPRPHVVGSHRPYVVLTSPAYRRVSGTRLSAAAAIALVDFIANTVVVASDGQSH